MTPLQNLYYAMGELAYAVACADGEIQKEERQRLHDIVREEVERHNAGYEISGIIFQLMDKEKADWPDAYHRAMSDIRLNSHYLSPDLKKAFVAIMKRIAEAYPPVTIEEQRLMDRFSQDIEPLRGDPVYYGQKG